MTRDPNNPRWGYQPRDPRIRFIEKIAKHPNGCWLWTGSVTKSGYGRFGLEAGSVTWAHRAAWRLFRGEIPVDQELDHLCRVRRCVNPEHLEPVSHQENSRRAHLICSRGLHDLTAPHARLVKGGCRACYNKLARDRWSITKARREAKARGEEVVLEI